MLKQPFQNKFALNLENVITYRRKYKLKRNISMPDVNILTPNKRILNTSKEIKLKKSNYNKWYIRPEERLKNRLDSQATYQNNSKNVRDFYESLYESDQSWFPIQSNTAKYFQNQRVKVAEQLTNNNSTYRMMKYFKNKKQSSNKRIPKIVDYFIRHYEQKDKIFQQKIRNRIK